MRERAPLPNPLPASRGEGIGAGPPGQRATYHRFPADWRSSAPAQVLFGDLTLRRELAAAEAGALFRLRIRRTVEALGVQIKRALFGPEEPLER